MARSLDQVLAEVTARSDPQRQTVLNQISSLPTQQAADESSLGAKKDQAYQDITDSARRKGLGFSGIPLGEQAQYAATDYAPALASLKTNYGNRRSTLESALSDIGKNDYSTAYDMFNQDRAFEEQQRQFNTQLAESRRASAASASGLAALYGQGQNQNQGQQQGQQQAAPAVDNTSQTAYNDVKNLLNKDGKRIQQEYEAIKKSAAFGNTYDKIKLQLIEQLYPAARNFGKNTVSLGGAQPTIVRNAPVSTNGRVVQASPGSIRF